MLRLLGAGAYLDRGGPAVDRAAIRQVCFEVAGQRLSVGAERIRAPEVLFQPSLAGVDAEGVHHLVRRCILGCDVELQEQLLEHVQLAGNVLEISFKVFDWRWQCFLSAVRGAPHLGAAGS